MRGKAIGYEILKTFHQTSHQKDINLPEHKLLV